MRTPSLVERLGHAPTTKLVIISCDDLGSCHAANVGVYGALRNGLATRASLMVPAPWARDAAFDVPPDRRHRRAPHAQLRVRGLSLRPDHPSPPHCSRGEGGFPRHVDDLWEHADPEEVLRECRAQIERALACGASTSPTSTPHLTAITLRPEFFDVYLELAVEFRLPVRLPSTITAEQAGFPFRQLADEEGVAVPRPLRSRLACRQPRAGLPEVAELQPGVTEIHVQPAIDTPEVRALSSHAPSWIDDYELVTNDARLDKLLAAAARC